MEAIVESTGGQAVAGGGEGGPIPEPLRRAIAVYEAGKALIAYVTPEYEEIARVSGGVAVAPGTQIVGGWGSPGDGV